MASAPTLSYQDYTVGWICALPVEMAAAVSMLQERHPSLPSPLGDENSYILGRIEHHNVVIACLPAGVTGTMSAAKVATQMFSSFKGFRFGLMVGIGGGAPSAENDIRLGDVVVSHPRGVYGGVIQYDFGKAVREGRFERTGSSNKPPSVLLTALANLQSKELVEGLDILRHIPDMAKPDSDLEPVFMRPGNDHDLLFEADYNHPEGNKTCDKCAATRLIPRKPRSSNRPAIHYGLIASGDQVMRNGITRDKLVKELGVLCFEMEAAGLVDNFPCLVVRGICDYADTHKSKIWQPFAAAAAAAYAKELLMNISAGKVDRVATPTDMVGNYETTPSAPSLMRVSSILNQPTLERSSTISSLALPNASWPEFQNERHALSSKFVDRIDTPKELAVNGEVWSVETRRCPWTFVLCGLGGVGKSQLCLRVIVNNEHKYRGVFYVDASSQSSADSHYLDIASACGIRRRWEAIEADEQIRLVRTWLGSQKDPWLLMLDNADSAEMDLTRYIPRGGPGTIIITTTDERLASSSSVFCKLESMREDDAINLLLSYKRPGLDLTRAEKEAAALLATSLLGRLPLAIAQAGSYIFNKRCSYKAYCEEFDQSPQNPLRYDVNQGRGHHQTVWRTFHMSLDRIRKLNDEGSLEAVELLRTLAFFHYEGVNEEIFQEAWRNRREIQTWSADVTLIDPSSDRWDCPKLRTALELLYRYNLVDSSLTHNQQYSMHRLVHTICRMSLSPAEQTEYAKRAMSILARALAGIRSPISWIDDPSGLAFQRSLLPHIRSCLGGHMYAICGGPGEAKVEEWLEMILILARAFSATGHFSDAQLILREVCDTLEAGDYKHKSKCPIRARVMEQLAACEYNLGHHSKACALRKNVIDLFQAMQSDIEDICAAEMNLADSYWGIGQRAEALELSRQVLASREARLGAGEAKLLRTRRKVAEYLHSLNHRRTALELREKVLADSKIRDVRSDAERLDNVASMSALAESCQWDGQLLRCLELRKEVHSIRTELLGPDHPDTLIANDNLIDTKSLLTHHEERLEICSLREDSVRRWSTLLGDSHPHTLEARVNLGHSYSMVRLWDKALVEQEAVLNARERQVKEQGFPENHPEHLSSIGNVASILLKKGNFRDALTLRKRALEISKKFGGPDNPTTAKLTNRLANCYASLRTTSSWNTALEMRRSLLASQEASLSENDPNLLATMSYLGDDLMRLSRRYESTVIWRKVLERQQTSLGQENRQTLDTKKKLVLALADGTSWMEHREATTLMEQVEAVESKLLGDDNPQIRATRIALYTIYHSARENKKARKLAKILKPDGSTSYVTKRDLHMIQIRAGSDLETDQEEDDRRKKDLEDRRKHLESQPLQYNAPSYSRKRKRRRKERTEKRKMLIMEGDDPEKGWENRSTSFADREFAKIRGHLNERSYDSSSSYKTIGESGSEAEYSPSSNV